MMRLTTILLSLALAATATTGAAAQTTGVPGFNDYTINALGGGTTTDCTTALIVPAGPVTFSVDTSPNTPVVFLFSLFCPCQENFFPLPVASGCRIPLTANVGTSNQSVDLNLTCTLISATVTSNSAGIATIVIPLPLNFRMATQAAAVHPCVPPGFPVLFSQAHMIGTI